MIRYFNGRWQDVMPFAPPADLVICDPMYADADLEYLYVAARALRPGGSLYVFSDASGVARIKVWLDSLRELRFQNWLIWGPNDWGGRSKTRWGQKHDDILFYTRVGADHTFNVDAVAVPKKMTGKVFNPSGRTTKIPNSVWDDLAGFSTVATERVKINDKVAPWQKPERVIERIIKASSNPKDMVLDFFSGVATVPVVCARLERHCLATEENPLTHHAGYSRLLKEYESLAS